MTFKLTDVIAYFLNGLIVGLLIWFMHSSYKTAEAHGYTPAARAHFDELVAAYQEPDMSNIKPLRMSDLNEMDN